MEFIPVPDGEFWGCLLCALELGRSVCADVLLVRGEIGQPGFCLVALCGNHAEVFIDPDEDTTDK